MKFIKYILFSIVLLSACKTNQEIDARWARNRNAGKKLVGRTVVYTIFVDTKTTYEWTGFDLASTKDSINRVVDWIKKEADKNGQSLEIITAYYGTESKPTFKKNMPYDHLYEGFKDGEYSEGSKLGKWVEGIVKKIGKELKLPNNESLPKKPKLKPAQILVEKLKRIYSADNVTINLMINNYFVVDISAIFNHMTDQETDVEFIITSGKNTYNFCTLLLSLYGAEYLSDGDYNLYNIKRLDIAKTNFPKDIMVGSSENIDDMEISAFTAYMIGWTEKISTDFVELFKIEPKKNKVGDGIK